MYVNILWFSLYFLNFERYSIKSGAFSLVSWFLGASSYCIFRFGHALAPQIYLYTHGEIYKKTAIFSRRNQLGHYFLISWRNLIQLVWRHDHTQIVHSLACISYKLIGNGIWNLAVCFLNISYCLKIMYAMM